MDKRELHQRFDELIYAIEQFDSYHAEYVTEQLILELGGDPSNVKNNPGAATLYLLALIGRELTA